MKKYLNLYITIKEEYYDLAYGILYDYPIIGIEEKVDELVLSFETKNFTKDVREQLILELKKIDSNIKINNLEEIDDYDWTIEFINNTKPVRINDKIGICPSWRYNELNTDLKVIIDPKMSFGTGEHSTTKMMCILLDKYIKEGDIIVDAGCGTGILSILASKLKAKKVYSFDNDEWAIKNSLENFKLNNVNNIDIKLDTIENYQFPDSNLILANLFINIIKYSFPKFKDSLSKNNGLLIVSGILNYDKDELIKSALDNGFEQIEILTDQEWLAFVFKIKK